MRKVLIDCFFYKFYMDEEKYNEFNIPTHAKHVVTSFISKKIKSIQKTLPCVKDQER